MGYYQECMRRVPERLNALERAGYLVDRSLDMVKCTFGDGAGGHHTDVGGGAKIVAGKVYTPFVEFCSIFPLVELCNLFYASH